jgi:hypothetical protein
VCLHERNGSGADSREDINCSGMDRIRGRAEGCKLEVEHKAGSDGIILHGGYSCTLCLRSVCQLEASRLKRKKAGHHQGSGSPSARHRRKRAYDVSKISNVYGRTNDYPKCPCSSSRF